MFTEKLPTILSFALVLAGIFAFVSEVIIKGDTTNAVLSCLMIMLGLLACLVSGGSN